MVYRFLSSVPDIHRREKIIDSKLALYAAGGEKRAGIGSNNNI